MFRKTVLVLAMVAATVALILAIAIGGGTSAPPRAAAPAFGNAEASTPPAETGGEFTGNYLAGVPIYRLPPITVTANRKVELAKIEREERELAQARAERARTSTTVHAAAMAIGAQ